MDSTSKSREDKIKEAAEKEAAYQQSNIGMIDRGARKSSLDRIPLRDRIHTKINRIHRDSFELDALKELDMLLDKNPEVARILELIEILEHYI